VNGTSRSVPRQRISSQAIAAGKIAISWKDCQSPSPTTTPSSAMSRRDGVSRIRTISSSASAVNSISEA
jgi:hypothetical protein